MSEIKNLDVENSCRACMRTGIPLRSVLEEAIDGESFLNIIESLCDKSVASDGLSKKICYKCQETGIVYWEFGKTVLQSQNKVLEIVQDCLANVQDDDEYDVFDDQSTYKYDDAGSFHQELEDLSTVEQEEFPFEDDSVYKSVCELCSEEFSADEQLEDHMKLHNQVIEVYACETCSEEFPTLDLLNVHFASHAKKRKNSETSDASKPKVLRHHKDASGRFICKICNGSYSNRDILTRHMVRHYGTKDHKCCFCPREFFFARDLKVHLKQHTEPKQKFFCHLCDSESTTKSAYKRHLLLHSEPKFKCSECNQSFSTKGILSKHSLTHTKEKPFICLLCSTAFSQKVNLVRHAKTKHAEKLYSCTWCESSFEMHRELREHWAECSNLRNRDKFEEFIEEEEIDSDYQAVKSIEMEFGEDES